MNPSERQLSIVVPCYNEEQVLPETAQRLADKLDYLASAELIGDQSRVFFVNDGSVDQTWPIVERLARQSGWIEGIKLSCNRGHQSALMAGLLTVGGDVVVTLDADLQDDPNAIDDMLRAHSSGADIVYGVRSSRKEDTAIKRTTAQLYYWLLASMGVRVVYNHSDYRLMSRRAVETLRGYGESNLFLRGLIPQLGFRSETVRYERSARFAGTSKYPLRKMLALALEGITSFSIQPLRLITALGILVSAVTFILGIWAVVAAVGFKATVPGWTSTVVPIYFMGGIQMLCLGIIGEYIGKIYLETKRRPRYVIEQLTWTPKSSITETGAPP